VVNNDAATLRALYVGAEATVIDKSTAGTVLDGLANADANWWPVNPPIQAGHGYEPHQKLCTPSPPGTVVTPTNELSAPVLVSPICPDDRSVTILGTVVNATVVLYRAGTALPIGVGGAGPGEVELNVGPAFLPLKVGDVLFVRQYLGSVISPPSNNVPVVDCRNVVTQHNDNHRTGAYLHETSLTPATVGSPGFGRLYERQVDGSPFAQILYVRNVAGTPLGTKNLFFVATSTNMVYAFDADDHSPGASAGLAWKASLGPTRLLNAAEICRETWGPVGVTSTPVIDMASETIYVAARHWTGSTTPTPAGGSRLDGDYYLHALKLSDGTDRVAPRKIDGHDPVTGLDFLTFCQRNRPGLLLLNGIVYLGFGTFNCDSGPYRGWVLGYRASDLKPAAIFATSKTAGRAGCGVWQSGNGLVGTDDGYLYFETGNESQAGDKLGDSFVRLRVLPQWPGLQEAGHFQPSNAAVLRPGDTDLGSGGPVMLPGQRLIGGGKQGRYYVLDPQTMKLTQDATSPDPAKVGEGFQAFVNNDRNVAADQADLFRIYATGELFGPNIHGGPCYWRGPSFIYQMPEKDYLKAFFYDRLSGLVQQDPVKKAIVRPSPGMPGGHSSLSANEDIDGIVWTCVPIDTTDTDPEHDIGQWWPAHANLVAFDALSLNEIWRDHTPEWFAKFNPPTIADGKVFRPVFAQYAVPPQDHDDGSAPSVLGPGKVIVYGLLNAPHSGTSQHHWGSWRGGRDPEPRFSISEKWQRHGGSGALAHPVGEEIELGDTRGGRRRDFEGWVAISRGVAEVSCHRPPTQSKPVFASIYWSEATGAHIVRGEIRDEYLRQGGHASELGYPIADEGGTADGKGRVSYFECGEIVWYPDTGAETRVRSL
jgi:hypothetical protein